MTGITLSRIAEMTGGALVGDGSRTVTGVCSPEDSSPDRLCVVWDRAMASLVPDDVPMLGVPGALSGRDGIEMKHPKAALPVVLPLFDRRRPSPPGIHPSAVLSGDCEMGAGVSIGPNCVVGSGAKIGDRVVLQANVVIGCDVSLGDDTVVEAGVVVHDFTEVGRSVVLHSGVVIGCDGFGFIPQPEGSWRKIPQIGNVVLEDFVEIGAGCSVDRATFGTTRIGRGTKIGAFVHVAHNCDIGEDCVMAGFSALGGSAKIGDGSIIAGMVGVADHVVVGKGVTVAGRSGVTKDIRDGVTISGYPARDHMEENRFQATLRRVPSRLERLKELEREVRLLRERIGDEAN